jgi:hypothetical protein
MAENQLINIKIRKKSPVCQADFPASRPGKAVRAVRVGSRHHVGFFE